MKTSGVDVIVKIIYRVNYAEGNMCIGISTYINKKNNFKYKKSNLKPNWENNILHN